MNHGGEAGEIDASYRAFREAARQTTAEAEQTDVDGSILLARAELAVRRKNGAHAPGSNREAVEVGLRLMPGGADDE